MHLRVTIKRILLKHGYWPDRWEKSNWIGLEQDEVLSVQWAARRNNVSSYAGGTIVSVRAVRE